MDRRPARLALDLIAGSGVGVAGHGDARDHARITATIFIVVIVLSWLNRRHAVLQERRNRPRGGNALEMLLVASAGIAIVGFGVWFFGFAGASPVPLNIGF